MRIILNEKEYIENILKKGDLDQNNPMKTLYILAKCYRVKGMDKDQNRKSLDSFMDKYYKKFNPVRWMNRLDEVIKISYKSKEDFKLLEIKSLKVSTGELNSIRSLDNIKQEKVAFVLLIYSKIYNIMNNNKSNWINGHAKDIFIDAKMPIGLYKQDLIFHEISEKGLITPSVIVDCLNIKVLFADEDDSTGLEICDFRDYIYSYLKWRGEKIGDCEGCGVLYRVTGKNNKYCKNCWGDYRRNYKKEKQREYRSK